MSLNRAGERRDSGVVDPQISHALALLRQADPSRGHRWPAKVGLG
jgi:hypothetical protein